MNILLVLVGIALILTACVRGITATETVAPEKLPEAENGDQRIILYKGRYWIESYAEYPGWRPIKIFDSLNEARDSKKHWDAVHVKDDSKYSDSIVID